MKNTIYFVSPKKSEIGLQNSLSKKPLKMCPTVRAMTKNCKSTALKERLLKVHGTKTFYLPKKTGNVTFPISPLLTKHEKLNVKQGKSWLMNFDFETSCLSSDDESECDEYDDVNSLLSSSSSDSDDKEFFF